MSETKFVVVQGRGRVGKSCLTRVMIERMEAEKREAYIADIDRSIASLSAFIDGVNRPPSLDDYTIIDWLHALINEQVKEKTNVLCDVGGGDLLFSKIANEVALVTLLTDVGIVPVTFWVLGPDPAEVGMMDEAQRAGFWPEASTIVLSAALAPPGQPVDEAFKMVRKQDAYRRAVDSGTREIIFPRLSCLNRVNELKYSFTKAARSAEFGLTYSYMVRKWLQACEAAFEPVSGWLP